MKDLAFSLMVSDSRTLDALLERAGLASVEATDNVSPSEFLVRQHFIDPEHEILEAVRHALDGLKYS
jgi:hypothetical protein